MVPNAARFQDHWVGDVVPWFKRLASDPSWRWIVKERRKEERNHLGRGPEEKWIAEGGRTRQVLKTISIIFRNRCWTSTSCWCGRDSVQAADSQLGFWLHESPGDVKANPGQRCVCFPSGSLPSLPRHCLAWGLLSGHTFSVCHTELGTCAQGRSWAAKDRSRHPPAEPRLGNQ